MEIETKKLIWNLAVLLVIVFLVHTTGEWIWILLIFLFD